MRLIGQDVGCDAWQDSATANHQPPEEPPCISPETMMELHAIPVRLYRADGWSGFGIVECNQRAGTFRAYNPDIGYLPYWTYQGFGAVYAGNELWWARSLGCDMEEKRRQHEEESACL